MRICIDLTALADNLSGIERYAACISLELLKHQKDHFILLFKDDVHPMFRNYFWSRNIDCVVIPGCNKLLFNQVKLPFVLHKIKADYYLFMAFPAPVFSFKKNMVSTIHDICCWDCPETMKGMLKWYFRISHRVAIKKCKAIITISEFSKKRIHEKLNYPNDKIWLIYCGIDQDEFTVHPERSKLVREKYNLPDEYILSLSTLEPRKNLPLLIHAYEDLIQRGEKLPNLVLAGRKGWKMDGLLEAIDEKVKMRITFTGFVDDSDLSEVYGNAKFFVYPSMYEGFGMPPLEAIACGTPVISSDAASLPEVLGGTARYFVSGNKEALEKAIIQSINCEEDEEFRNLTDNQLKKFSWAAEANKLYELINEGKSI